MVYQSPNGEHHPMAPMLFGLRVVMLGRQGSGKGTQGVQLAKLLVVPHISVGDVLRDAVSSPAIIAGTGPSLVAGTTGLPLTNLTLVTALP